MQQVRVQAHDDAGNQVERDWVGDGGQSAVAQLADHAFAHVEHGQEAGRKDVCGHGAADAALNDGLMDGGGANF